MSNAALASRASPAQAFAYGRAVRRMIALAFLAIGSTLVPGQAHGEGNEIARAGPSVEIICDRDATLGAGPASAPSDGKVCAALPIWKTITLGTYDSAAALREAVRRYTGRLAGQGLDGPNFSVSKTKTHIDLVLLSVAELGFEGESAPLAEIYSRATQLGLEPVPAEVAPQLRLQYLDQPVGEFLHIAMKPLATERGDFVGLSLANGGAGLLLLGGDGRPNLSVPSTVRVVFARPR
jgi:hypothetical protein